MTNNTKIERFEDAKLRNSCHYACSSFSYTKLILIVLIIIFIYHTAINNIV